MSGVTNLLLDAAEKAESLVWDLAAGVVAGRQEDRIRRLERKCWAEYLRL